MAFRTLTLARSAGEAARRERPPNPTADDSWSAIASISQRAFPARSGSLFSSASSSSLRRSSSLAR